MSYKNDDPRKDMAVRFWNKVVFPNDNSACWLWIANKDKDGYGKFTKELLPRRAHRMAWEFFNGRIPKGLWVLHKCDNPPCVNPEHLFLGTNSTNIKDAYQKGLIDQRGIRNHRTHLSEADVLEIRRLHATGKIEQNVIGRMFRIHPAAISQITRRITWAHIGGARSNKKWLSDADALEIRRLYATGKFTHAEIGKMFRVGRTAISNITNGRNRRHLEKQ